MTTASIGTVSHGTLRAEDLIPAFANELNRTLDTKFWAKRGRKILGPYPTREAALTAFKESHPVKGADWQRNAKKNDILTGYGTFGPHFDIRWNKGA